MNPHLATEALPTTQNLAAVIISQVYLSKNQWKYKLGLAGYEKQLYAEAPESASYVWHNICLPTNWEKEKGGKWSKPWKVLAKFQSQ
nr:uncharacterized protein LOC107433613 isoform X2 [Ziziphus jujuba var. spinosa]